MTPIDPPAPQNSNAVAFITALGLLAGAIITLFTVFEAVHWSAGQTALVTAEVAALSGLATAVVLHLRSETPEEYVAVAATFTAAVSATLALGTGFGWWHMTEEETGALLGVVTALIGVGSALFARQHVIASETPPAK